MYDELSQRYPTAYWDEKSEDFIDLEPSKVELIQRVVVQDIKTFEDVVSEVGTYSDCDAPIIWDELFGLLRAYPNLRAQFLEITGTLVHCARYQFGMVGIERRDKQKMLRAPNLRPTNCIWTCSWDLTSGPCW